MMIDSNAGRTESYLVRLWCDTRSSPWRASLQNIRTRQVTYFARPEELWAFLQAEMTGPETARSGQVQQVD